MAAARDVRARASSPISLQIAGRRLSICCVTFQIMKIDDCNDLIAFGVLEC